MSSTYSGYKVVISATTNATPVVVTTSTSHNRSTGDSVLIGGTGIVDGVWTITKIDATNFSLNTSLAPGSTSAAGSVYFSPAGYTIPSDGDTRDAASVDVALEAIGDQTRYLLNRGYTIKCVSQTYSANGTFQVPYGLIGPVTVVGCGGGGGGGGGARPATASFGSTRGGGGGGGGGAVVKTFTIASGVGGLDLTPGAGPYAITIGAGGSAGTAATADNTNGGDGGDGGDTSFGSYCKFAGGQGGLGGAKDATTGSIGGASVRGVNRDYATGASAPTGVIVSIGPGYGSTGGNKLLNTSGYLATAANPSSMNPSVAAAPSPTKGTDSTGLGGYAAGGGGTSDLAAGGAAGLGGNGDAGPSPTAGTAGTAGAANTGAGGGGGGGGGNASGTSANGGAGAAGGSGSLTIFYSVLEFGTL